MVIKNATLTGHCPLGMEYGYIKDEQITASSTLRIGHGPNRARLNSRNSDLDNNGAYGTGDDIGGWHPAVIGKSL